MASKKAFQNRARSAAMIGGLVFGLASGQGALAANVTGTFDVKASLASVCESTTGSVPVVDFGVFTAFTGPATQNPTAALTFRCTRGLSAPVFALDDNGDSAISSATGTVGSTPATGSGLLSGVGLNYGLSIVGARTQVGALATGALNGIGSADEYTFTVTGSMETDQAGTCASATCSEATQTRTLTITY